MPKTPNIRIGLYVTEKSDYEWFHVHAYPVIIGPTLYELRHMDQTGEPHNVEPTRIRGCVSSAWSDDETGRGLYLADLYAVSQGNQRDTERRLYGWDVEYREVYSIDARKAERMHKTLTTIARRMQKTREQYGAPATFGTYLAHVAQAIGADAIVRPWGKQRPCYDDTTHRIDSIADGTYSIDRTIEAWSAREAVSA